MHKIVVLLCCVVMLAVGGEVSAQDRKRGDMDGDGGVTINDISLIVKYMLDCRTGWGTTQVAQQLRAYADVDCDSQVSLSDVSALADVLLARHEAVDLGLSVRWATMNVGATSVVDFGDYYAWGEIAPKSSYTENNYVYYGEGAYQSIGNSIGGTRYDVAKAVWGDGWHLPTLIDINELKNKCTWEAMTLCGVAVYKVTGPSGNSIYLPLAGYKTGDETKYVGEECYYWCGMKPSTASAAYCLYGQNYTGNWSANRSYGFTIRPVRNR